MNDLTLDKFEKSYLNSSIITDESTINDYHKKLMPCSPQTAAKAFSSFKHLLYLHSFYSLNNPALNIATYCESKTHSMISWYLSDYVVPETSIPVLRLVLNYFSSRQILTLTKSTNYFEKEKSDKTTFSTPTAYFTEAAYLATDFTWKIPLNFMPIFSAIVYAVYKCFHDSTFSMNKFLAELTDTYTYPNKKIIFSDDSDTDFFIDNQKSDIHIHFSKDTFIDILTSWADKYLAAPFFKNLDFLYTTYAQDNSYHQTLLYKSVQTLTATLISDYATPEIYLDINTLLENHIKYFPDASATEEIENLYPHIAFHQFTERELHLVANYIENTNTWNKKLLLNLKDLISYLELSSFPIQEKCNYIDQTLSDQKNFVAQNSKHLENKLNNEFNELSQYCDVDSIACSEHIKLIHNMLAIYTNKLISELDLRYSMLKKHYHSKKYLLQDIIYGIEHFFPIYTQDLTDDWYNLKNKNKFPVFMKVNNPGTLNNPPLNFYAKTLAGNDVFPIVQQLHFDLESFNNCYINSYNELAQTGIFLIFGSPAHLALALSKYHKLKSNS